MQDKSPELVAAVLAAVLPHSLGQRGGSLLGLRASLALAMVRLLPPPWDEATALLGRINEERSG